MNYCFSEEIFMKMEELIQYINDHEVSSFHFLEIAREFINDTDVLKVAVRRNSVLFSYLSDEHRNDPELFKIAIEHNYQVWFNPVRYALPSALTKDNIDLIISKELYDESVYLLDHKYYVLHAIKNNKVGFFKISERLKQDPFVVHVAWIFQPELLSYYDHKFITDTMNQYIISHQIEVNSSTIRDVVLSDSDVVKKVLSLFPDMYLELADHHKSNFENIKTILENDGNYFNLIPLEYVTDECIMISIMNGYQFSYEHFDIMNLFFTKMLNENPDFVYDLFVSTSDTKLQLFLMSIIIKSKVERTIEVNDTITFIIQEYTKTFQQNEINETYISSLMKQILNGEVWVCNLDCIHSMQELLYVSHFGNLFMNTVSGNNNDIRLQPIILSNLSFDIYTKTNLKQYRDIKRILLDMGMDDFSASEIAITTYSVLGFSRAKELLSGKYGDITIDQLCRLFTDINCSHVMFEPDGGKYKPIINETLINLLFGSNYKVMNTPIRNYLNGFCEMEQYILHEIEVIQNNCEFTQDEKIKKTNEVSKNFKNYCFNVRDFIANINFIFHKWNDIEEEFLKKQSVSKLKIKLNVAQVNEIVTLIKSSNKNTFIRGLFTEKEQLRASRIPDFELRDYPLVISDVFDYVGIQTQYTVNPKMAPLRAVELSRMMEGVTSLKIPDVSLNYGEYRIKVFHPQDRNLISGGYRTGCCFRPKGDADNYGQNHSLLAYCCSSEYASGIEIKDYEGKTLMFSPILRNGNVLVIYSFESIGLTEKEQQISNDLLYSWASEVIRVSQKEENDNSIIAVVISDLKPLLDFSRSQGILPKDKKFKVYDPEHKYKRMYYELDKLNQYVLAFSENKTFDDIKYDKEVIKSYHYPTQVTDIKSVVVNDHQLEIIHKIRSNKEKIIELAKKRKKLLKLKKEEIAFDLLKLIYQIRKENLSFQKKLYRMNENTKRDIFSDYIYGIEIANHICDQLNVSRKAEMYHFKQIIYSNGWYIGVTRDHKIYGDCINHFESDFIHAIIDLKNQNKFMQDDEYPKLVLSKHEDFNI